jgi:HD-GYP domain-containing protein (c-di-GMP phosphodiesterase class II)
LTGDQITLGARIFAVADAVDAITSDRPYRRCQPFEAAAEELSKCAGTHFDPTIVRAFIEVPMECWREIRQMSTEPGLVIQDDRTGKEIRYSNLTMNGDRVSGEWV